LDPVSAVQAGEIVVTRDALRHTPLRPKYMESDAVAVTFACTTTQHEHVAASPLNYNMTAFTHVAMPRPRAALILAAALLAAVLCAAPCAAQQVRPRG